VIEKLLRVGREWAGSELEVVLSPNPHQVEDNDIPISLIVFIAIIGTILGPLRARRKRRTKRQHFQLPMILKRCGRIILATTKPYLPIRGLDSLLIVGICAKMLTMGKSAYRSSRML
jgi:hypothetical protein